MVSCSRLCSGSGTAIASCATVMSGPWALSPMPLVRCSGGVRSARKTLCQTTTAPGRTSPTYKIVLGKSSSNTRGSMSALTSEADSLSTMSLLTRTERGARRSVIAPATNMAMKANSITGNTTLRLEHPAARMAVISPSVASRPNPTRMPTSVPNGMVSGSSGGSDSANRYRIVSGRGELRTSTSNSLPTPCRKMMDVAKAMPSSELEMISRKMWRPRMRMRLRVAGLGSQLRGRHNGELRRFFFKRMQFHVVDQHRGRDYAALRYIVRAADQRKRRLVVQEFEHIVIVARAQDVFERSRVQTAEPQAAYQFLPAIRIPFVPQHRRAHRMAARLRRIAQQPPHLFERSRRWEIHSAHDRAIRLVALLAHFDQFLLEVRYRYGFRGAHKKIANGRAIRAKAAGQTRPSIGAGKPRRRLPREQKSLQHALFHQRQRPGSHALAIHFVAAEKWTAVPFFLRRVVHHVEPLRQNTRALAALQLAHRREAVAARFHHGPPRQSQIAAQNFGEELGAGRAFK